jgi:hypothetical protein
VLGAVVGVMTTDVASVGREVATAGEAGTVDSFDELQTFSNLLGQYTQ